MITQNSRLVESVADILCAILTACRNSSECAVMIAIFGLSTHLSLMPLCFVSFGCMQSLSALVIQLCTSLQTVMSSGDSLCGILLCYFRLYYYNQQ